MAAARSPRDNRLLDAVEALPFEPWTGTAWRVVRDGREPTQCSAVGGRWDDRTFEVLYTSTHPDGARAEMYFHLSRGQPVIPSQVRYGLHELTLSLTACVRIASLDVLAGLGLKTSIFGQLAYSDRQTEYPRTQEIAEASHFHGRDGLLVPSARSEHPNLVVFCGPAGPDAFEAVKDHGVVDWNAWRAAQRGG
jgi:RES domain-containing protein